MKNCLLCIKFLVTFLNCLVMIFGFLFAGFFIWVLSELSIMSKLSDTSAEYIIYIFIGIGVSMVMMGFLGCCGAIRESKCMLGTFFTCMVILFGMEIAASVWTYMNYKIVKTEFERSFGRAMNQYENNLDIKMRIDIAQEKLGCCGSKGYQDWQFNKYFSTEKYPSELPLEFDDLNKTISFEVPNSCCRKKICNRSFTNTVIKNDSINRQGCTEVVFNKLKDNKSIIFFVGIGVTVVQIFDCIFSLILAANVKKFDYY